MIVGVTMDVVASMVECSLVMIVTIQVSHGDGFLATHKTEDCSQPFIFSYFYSIFEHADRITREQGVSVKRETMG